MLEGIVCALVTILPDYLLRRYLQGKRIGHEITIYSVWFELRWGIVSWLILTISLITVIFYFHPSSTSAVSYFRTVPILPEGSGRVEEVYVGLADEVKAGQPILRLDASKQEAALETAQRRIEEIEAQFEVAQSDVEASEARLRVANGGLQQALDELNTRTELRRRNPDTVPTRQLEQLQVTVDTRQASVDEARAAQKSAQQMLGMVLPAQQASAKAQLAEAQVAIDKTVVYAGVDGRVEQFTLRVGDIVNPLMRPAGVLVPEGAGRSSIVAGFSQIEARVIRRGMAAEVACGSVPFRVIPMVVAGVQDVIATGQLQGSDLVMDVNNAAAPGSITVLLEPMFEGGMDDILPGSTCAANIYTDNHELLDSGEVSGLRYIGLHVVDTVGLVHAAILRIHTLLLPVKTLVLTGGGH